MLARALTHALVGLEPRRVEVEAHLQGGVPGFAIVGLADRACQEAKELERLVAFALVGLDVVLLGLSWVHAASGDGERRPGRDSLLAGV
jgi:hypothetical protein